jgi:hypothetical protein
VNEQTVDSVALVNSKILGEMHAMTAALATQTQAQQQQRINELSASVLANSMNSAQQLAQLAGQQALNLAASQAQLQQAITGRVARFMLDLSAEQATAFAQELGSNLTSKLADIGSVVSGIQQDIKGAQTTPPQTGTGGAFGSDSGSPLLQQLASNQALLAQQLGAMNVILQDLAAKKP